MDFVELNPLIRWLFVQFICNELKKLQGIDSQNIMNIQLVEFLEDEAEAEVEAVVVFMVNLDRFEVEDDSIFKMDKGAKTSVLNRVVFPESQAKGKEVIADTKNDSEPMKEDQGDDLYDDEFFEED
ncbi:hypothetical protein PIB30_084073 [Stylosanthes scabra]|uniref:Uncharacterized protein n=1 Tax=Stylosanthes scabra TaxID=79078 RepID=A0ABU6UUU0_9FABA|nr:hypothetical protein [Stylosanthes scabra]